ncbi:unnamed protein product [Ostreobium quekettii]|uniref:Deoxyribodipyrimidine photo-lyase n=1 Tax=Ostreobium quekettii TaxID=121088 RepID=A0A8S1INV9_9CHLO|nr:unnamed protein product [Ostreobium quekettii]
MGISVHPTRLRALNGAAADPAGRFILYWMSQSVRTRHNPALAHAAVSAARLKLPLLTAFVLDESQPYLNKRHYAFLFDGLRDVKKRLEGKALDFLVVRGKSVEIVPKMAERGAAAVVTDCGYLRWGREVREQVGRIVGVEMTQVEGDVVVPVEVASDKQEWAARTIRPKIHRQMETYLGSKGEDWSVDLGEIINDKLKNGEKVIDLEEITRGFDVVDVEDGFEGLKRGLEVDCVPRVVGCRGGEEEAERVLAEFLEGKLGGYAEGRNEPANDMQSGLSPYLRFGNISAVHVARRAFAASSKRTKAGVDSFTEELIVRRELAVNFVFYAKHVYDSYSCLPNFAKTTLEEHEGDKRKYIYTYEEFEAGCTHDEYWNAAQMEIVVTGKMHGYMRMYWAKKILEWTEKPRTAISYAIRLNNRWGLDGEDPNSYAGILWCFGLHDHGWTEREIFGKVRYMNDSGLKRKFNMGAYIKKVGELVKKHGLPPELEAVQKRGGGQKRITDLFEGGAGGGSKKKQRKK